MNIQSAIHQDLEFSFEAKALPGALSVLAFEADDALFECYEVRVDLASMDDNIDLTRIVDTDASLMIRDKYDQPRYFYGVISEAEAGDVGVHRSFYSVTLRPALHRLNYVSDSRIFQDISVPDIVAKLLKENGVNDVEWRLAESHLPREFCVQYNETSYDFIRRLLAEEGIAFWFEHSNQGAKLVLSDAPLSMPKLTHAPSITYNATAGGSDTRQSSIKSFRQTQRVRATDLHAKDYTFKRPAYGQDQKTRAQENAGEKSTYALYNYPGRYKNEGAGKPFTKYALEAERVSANQGTGTTDNIHLCSGHLFTLDDHPNDKLNALYRILSTHHKGTQYAALEEDAPAGDENATRYEARFTTMPQRLPFRPVNPNPKPQIFGSQIAIVTGPAGEEIYTDEHGRVKLHFPWDRHNAKDENSSCWIRVSQNWAGGSWGSIAIPRIGQEVIVDYLDGDPDQPIVVGRTYHATNKAPYALPANKTVMSIKSQTHKGEGYNELRFEDEAGREEVWMHAQKDHNTVIENDETHQIRNDRSKIIGNDQKENIANDNSKFVGNDDTEIVTNNKQIRVDNSRGQNIAYDDNLEIGNNLNVSVANNHTQTIGANSDLTVTANALEKIQGKKGVTVDDEYQTKTGGDFTIKSGGEIILDASKITLVSGGTALVISGGSVNISPKLNVGMASPSVASMACSI